MGTMRMLWGNLDPMLVLAYLPPHNCNAARAAGRKLRFDIEEHAATLMGLRRLLEDWLRAMGPSEKVQWSATVRVSQDDASDFLNLTRKLFCISPEAEPL